MRAIEAALRFLVKQGVKYIFGIPAGSINPLYDSLIDIPELKPIVAKHEGASGFMAAAYSRITGIPSVCIGSSGPGATNLVTPAAHAWREKLPVIFITGSVPSTKIGKGGAQELYAEPIFASITKCSMTVYEPGQLPVMLADAYHLARSGVPGPVHLAVPMDVQMGDIGSELLPELPPLQFMPADSASISSAIEMIQTAGFRGALLLGHGAQGSRDQIIQFAEKMGWFVATTPRGKGSFPENHPLSLGVYGLSGNTQAIRYLNGDDHDIIMVIGSSLGELATCNWEPKLVQGKKMIHIDYDRSEFGKNYEPALVIHGDIRMVMDQLMSNMETGIHSLVLSQAAAMRQIHEEKWQEEGFSWNARKAIQQIGRYAPSNTRFYVDIGESMTYCLHYLRIRENQQFDIDIDFGSMGSGIAGVIGAKLADPKRPTICITGDGCFFMHGMEVLTAKEYHLPIVFFVINNARLGMVYHGHMLQYKRCLEDFSQTRVNIASMASALGIRHAQIDGNRQIQEADLDEWLSAQGPVIVEIVVDGNDIPPMGERVKFLQQAAKT